MLEYCSTQILLDLARHSPESLRDYCGVEDPYRYYTTALIGEGLCSGRVTRANIHRIRIEIAPYFAKGSDQVYSGEYVEFHGYTTPYRLERLLQTLAGADKWNSQLHYFYMEYGSYTLFVRQD